MNHPFEKLDKFIVDKQKILDHIARMIESIPQNTAIRKLGSNYYTIMASELFKHKNWSPEFHDFSTSALIVNDFLAKHNSYSIRVLFDSILSSKSVTVHGKKQNLHPEFVEKLKEIYNS